ncbi:NADH-quinone oxidoreductase subunit L [Bdellovibrio reynosensis]|uniref:NADH-quinone oxidoreductase subunit L n=2 Tax=Bdellovibrio reynosensis TaxID=2835041 RepID=A0ABY4C6T7_9BACT|nr:NADH-quinone oxidoreductase subunit L [Bdellovibrio reynosensis]UOF00429.1 NADH-quinone oxidoreductase subunit L [Bdellovibrio reynosensis]
MNYSLLMALVILTPFVGFLINGLRYKKHSANLAGTIATIAVGISFICSIILVADLISLPEETRKIAVSFFDWMAIDKLKVSAGFVIDQISAIMILVITGVGTLIHLFSIGYMHHDKGAAKYFSYLNLFIFNMLLLVLGDNLLVMFVGWEGVGLCSYLLIGFWFTDKEKAAAGMKAFVTNRIGDAAFLLGMFVLFLTFGTLNFAELNALAPTTVEASWLGAATLGTLFLFIGATGKSAQIPLYVWLPDAMAGPTPVSALIHAATMVTAGVYMIVRLNPMFMAAPNTMMVIAIIGAATAVFAATIGITQNDIKKVLAYSTVSQLGYMFLACGVGAFGAAMFHLMTHAFFKALMFLGSGSVIHAMHEEQDIRKMGGLKKYLPITHLTFFLGWLAIIGMPPFAGFFSKDEILAYAFNSPLGSPVLWAMGAIGATLTAFYMTRLMALTFWGKSRVPSDIHPHESPALMLIPLIVLGVLSVIGGWIGIPHVIGEYLGHIPNVWEHWLHPLIKPIPGFHHLDAVTEFTLMGISVTLAAISAAVAYHFYVRSPETPNRVAEKIKPIYNVVYHKYFVDEGYFAFIINPLVNISRNTWYYVDVNFIDKMTYLAGDLVRGMGSFARSIQTGNMQQYAMYIGIGVVVALSFVIMR